MLLKCAIRRTRARAMPPGCSQFKHLWLWGLSHGGKKDVFLRLALHCEHNIEGCQESLEAATSDSTHGERVLSAARGPMTCIVAGALRRVAWSWAAQTADSPRCTHLAVLVQTQVVGVRPLGSLSRVSILPINWCWGARGAHGGDAVPLFQQLHLALAGRAREITDKAGSQVCALEPDLNQGAGSAKYHLVAVDTACLPQCPRHESGVWEAYLVPCAALCALAARVLPDMICFPGWYSASFTLLWAQKCMALPVSLTTVSPVPSSAHGKHPVIFGEWLSHHEEDNQTTYIK